MKKLVIFDMDGLLIDSETVYNQSWVDTMNDLGYEVPDDMQERMIGRTSAFVLEDLYELCQGKYERDYIYKLRNERLESGNMMDQVALLPGVKAVLDHYQAQGIPMGMATSSVKWLADFYLDKYGLRPYFRTIHTNEDVTKHKPDPAVYLTVLKANDTDASDSIAFEDSLVGAQAARAAGIETVLINAVASVRRDYLKAYPDAQAFASFEDYLATLK